MSRESPQHVWETALGELQVQVSKHNYQTWFCKTRGIGYEGNQFIVGVPNSFVEEYLNRSQRSLIRKTLIGITGRDVNIDFRVVGSEQYNQAGGGKNGDRLPTHGPMAAFNPKYTLDSFIVGGSNRFAHAAAVGITDNPGMGYNPLFIYGGSGLGKTHLLHGIGHRFLSRDLRVHYSSSEQFTNEFIDSIKERKTAEFRDKYRKVDCLMIDDIQFINGKEQTEECFFHTFNELHNANRQVVITSDRPPKLIPGLAGRLRSRFEWGLVADIQPPDFETRLAIIRSKAKQVEDSISPDTLYFIAEKLHRNIRELEGNLNRVIAYARLFNTLATPELAARALENISDKSSSRIPATPLLLAEAVASSFQLSLADLRSLKRDKEISLARQIAMYLMRYDADCPLAQIGRELGNRNPSTVSHACEKIAAELDSSTYLKRVVASIREKVSAG